MSTNVGVKHLSDLLMSQPSDLSIELQPGSTLCLGSLQLPLLELSNAFDANLLAKLRKNFSLCFVDRRLECVNAFLEIVVRRLCLSKLGLLLPEFAVDTLDFILDAVEAELARTLR